MLTALAPNLWYATHAFKVNGLPLTTRMTVVRLPRGQLWLHSPIPIGPKLKVALDALGDVAHIVAPSKAHHLFAGDCAAMFPYAKLWGTPGLRAKRPDLATLQDLPPSDTGPWCPELDHLLFEGIPLANETDWFHAPSGTLILTDLCQWMQGDLPLATVLYAKLTGVRAGLNVPHTVRLLVRDKAAARVSAARLLRWPIRRLVVAHNAVIETDAHAQLAQALQCLA